jgi:hypothetical protein
VQAMYCSQEVTCMGGSTGNGFYTVCQKSEGSIVIYWQFYLLV